MLRSAIIGALLGALTLPAAAGEPARDYSDRELVDGFMKTVFGVESPGRGPASEAYRVKKWDGRAISVAIINLSQPDRTAQVSQFLGVLNRTVQNVRFSEIKDSKKADMVIFLTKRSEYKSTIKQTMPNGYDTRFLESNDCSAVTGGPQAFVLSKAFIYLVSDEGDTKFRHCMVEEITQSLGPVNDNDTLTDSIYNDLSRVSTFTVFDWYILNMLYDHRVHPGMTADQASRALPAAIADCRKRLSRMSLVGSLSAR